jgi:polysaccharide biosynthesis protein PslH
MRTTPIATPSSARHEHAISLLVVMSATGMELLFVSPWHPWPATTAGAHQRIFHLVAELAKRHRLTLVTPAHAGSMDAVDDPLEDICVQVIRVPEAPPARPSASAPQTGGLAAHRVAELMRSTLPRSARWRHREFLCVLQQLRATRRFDAIWVERAFLGELVREAGFERIIIDIDDVESIALKRHLRHYYRTHSLRERVMFGAELLKVYSHERRLLHHYAQLVVCKETDRRCFGRDVSRVHVVPNGMQPRSQCDVRNEDPASLLFVGNLAHFPNVDAVAHFRDGIWPELERLRPDARFVVAGRSAPAALRALHDGHRCVFTGPVPDLAPIYETASVVVVPMRLGSGTRVKVLEALAHGKAMVSTSTGVEGLDLRPGVDVVVADEPTAFARACVRLLDDREARRRLGATARARVLDRFGWDRIADAADRVVRLAAEPRELATWKRGP